MIHIRKYAPVSLRVVQNSLVGLQDGILVLSQVYSHDDTRNTIKLWNFQFRKICCGLLLFWKSDV